METLKHLFLIGFLSISTFVFSQNAKEVQTAFSKSYTSEY